MACSYRMAGIAGSFLQSTFAAFSFAGAGYLFKMFDKDGYSKEAKRHNLALEKFNRDKEKFAEEEVLKHDRENQLRREMEEANRLINEGNKSLGNLAAARREYDTLMARKRAEPKLSNYHTPSGDMRYYQSVVAVVVGVGCGGRCVLCFLDLP